MPLATRRIFRLSFTIALALACGYGLALDMPFIAPIFALILTMSPGLPMPPKKLLVLVIALSLILAIGLGLIRLLEYYALSAVLIVACGVYLANFMSVNLGKGPLAMFLTVSLTLISAVGTLSWAVAASLIDAIALSVVIAIVCQWVVYPFFPEDGEALPPEAPPQTAAASNWIAVRATIIIMPVYLLTLTNPTFYAPIVMKAVSLGQQSAVVSAREAGRELLASTFLGGCFALGIWVALGVSTNLWMFFLWILLFCVFCAGRLYQVFPSRYPASFWSNVVITALILLGSAVQDAENGKDVYQAFAVRMSLFIAVTLYAWLAIALLEQWRERFTLRSSVPDAGGR